MYKVYCLVLAILFAGCVNVNVYKCETDLVGSIDASMVEKVKQSLKTANTFPACSKVRFNIYSPGGYVTDTLEIVRLLEEAKKDHVVETFGHTMVASGATFVLAAGTPGSRFVHPDTLVLVHGVQAGWLGCVELVEEPATEDAKITNVIIEQMATFYAKLTGRSYEHTLEWLKCDKSQVGTGVLALMLGLADVYER